MTDAEQAAYWKEAYMAMASVVDAKNRRIGGAAINLMTCQTCKHWESRELDEGRCRRIFHDSRLDSRPDAACLMVHVADDDFAPAVSLVTKGGFGCALHEEKPGD